MKINKQLKKLIEGNVLALSTVDKNGNPHTVAVGDVKVVSKNQILIGNCFMKNTIKNFQRNNNVALAVWNRNWEKKCIGYELKSAARYFTSGKWMKMVEKIHKGFNPKGAILVTVKKIKRLV
jgi:predicted pyridoxine 5'-phosphate oxidase superfamily flavin-nucleotide-binding protein